MKVGSNLSFEERWSEVDQGVELLKQRWYVYK